MINIIYRFCNTPCSERHNRPYWFSKINCFESLYQNFVIKDEYKIYCIQDGEDDELTYLIKSKDKIERFININYKSNAASLDFCLNYADNIKEGDYYFVEDDFLHRPNSNSILEEGLNKFGLITLYDHLDRYTVSDDITKNCESIALTNSCYWRTAESTTCTWACKRETWEEIKDDAKKFNLNDRGFFRHLIQKNIRLWSPIKAYSTHCMSHLLSPLIDWKKVNNEYII
jgi:hypothetical protein